MRVMHVMHCDYIQAIYSFIPRLHSLEQEGYIDTRYLGRAYRSTVTCMAPCNTSKHGRTRLYWVSEHSIRLIYTFKELMGRI